MFKRRRVQGFTDLGSVHVPPFPQHIVLTDRDDGTQWALSHQDDAGTPRVILTDTIPSTPDKYIYGANEGPIVATSAGRYRLLVRDGRLGYEDLGASPHCADRDQHRILTRKDKERTIYEIIEPADFSALDPELGYEDVTF